MSLRHTKLFSEVPQTPHPTILSMPSPSSFSNNAQQHLFAARMGTGAHNLTRARRARRDASRPYPSCVEVYTRSDMAECEDEFEDLFLNDFILAHKRVARRRLDRLELAKNRRALLARGVAPMMDVDDDQNGVVQACVRYAGAVGVMVIDEMAEVNERVRDLHIR